MAKIAPQHLHSWQLEGARNFDTMLKRVDFARSANTTTFEFGTDMEGKASVYLQQLIGGEFVGVNCHFNKDESFRALRGTFPNTVVAQNGQTHYMLTVCGQPTPFRTGSFDLVLSDNVIEHTNNLYQYGYEAWRLLKPGGTALFNVGMTWDGGSGHHIHDDIVHDWLTLSDDLHCPPTVCSWNFGRTKMPAGCSIRFSTANRSFIPSGSHLRWSARRMHEHLSAALPCPRLVDKIVHYIYTGQDINRHTSTQMKSILGSFRWKLLHDFNLNTGPPVRLAFRKHSRGGSTD